MTITQPWMRAHERLKEQLPVRTHVSRRRDAFAGHRLPAAVVDERRELVLQLRQEKPPLPLRDIGKRLGISKTAVAMHIAALRQAGRLDRKRRQGVSRG